MNSKKLLLCIVFTLSLSSAVFAGRKEKEQQRIRQLATRLEQVTAKRDSLNAVRWQNKYLDTEYRKEAAERLRNLDQDYNRILLEKNVAEEKSLRYQQELERKKEELEQKKEFYQNLRALGLNKLDAYKSSSFSRLPHGLEARINEQNRVQATLEKGSINGAVSKLLELRLSDVREAETQSLETATVLDDSGRTYKAARLRLGYVHFSDMDKTSGKTRMLLNTGRLKGKIYVWKSDLDKGARDDLNQAFQELSAETVPQTVQVPFDILQSKAMIKGLAQSRSDIFYMKIWSFLKQGGPVMIPLGLIALIALIMIIERMFFYARKGMNSRRLMKKLLPLLEQGKTDQVLAVCKSSTHTSLGRALCAVMEKAVRKESRKSAEKALQEAVLNEVPDLEKRLSTIAIFGSTAPLLGLLGTVAGMISLFEVITNYGTSDPKLLAGGISEALVTTETGLIVAIPIILMHNFLSNRENRIISEINRLAMTLLNRLWPEK